MFQETPTTSEPWCLKACAPADCRGTDSLHCIWLLTRWTRETEFKFQGNIFFLCYLTPGKKGKKKSFLCFTTWWSASSIQSLSGFQYKYSWCWRWISKPHGATLCSFQLFLQGARWWSDGNLSKRSFWIRNLEEVRLSWTLLLLFNQSNSTLKPLKLTVFSFFFFFFFSLVDLYGLNKTGQCWAADCTSSWGLWCAAAGVRGPHCLTCCYSSRKPWGELNLE